MTSLSGAHIFLSASFPSGERGREVEPYDASAIADAVTAVVRAVLLSEGSLLFGGHPTITPLVLMIGSELGVQNSVDIFQSRWFDQQVTEETISLAESGVGEIHWTPRSDSLSESLDVMRSTMLSFVQPACGIFVGGMSGIYQEFEIFGSIQPGTPRIPIVGPGGAAARLSPDLDELPAQVAAQLESRHYPFLASLIVDAIGEEH